MKTLIYSAVITACICLSACSKKQDDTTFNPAETSVKTITHSATGITETYLYNSDGKIQTLQYSDGSKITYAYDSAVVIQTVYNEAGGITTINHLQLDTNGLVTNTFATNATGDTLLKKLFAYNGNASKTTELTFTAENMLKERLEWEWNGFSASRFSIYDSTNTMIYDFYYTYYYPGETSAANSNKGQSFLGVDSRLLVRQSIRRSYLFGDMPQTFEYEFDSQKRITAAKTFNYNGKLTNTDSYNYY